MLFSDNPVIAGNSSGATTATAGLLSHQRHLIQHGTDLYWVLLNVSGLTPGILRSTDGGLTWAVQDSGYALPDTVRLNPDSLGDTIYVALTLASGDAWVVARFSMATNTYTSTSAPLAQVTFGGPYYGFHAAGVAASNGDFHLLVNSRVPGFEDMGPLSYIVESGGSWGSPVLVDPGYCGTNDFVEGFTYQPHGFRDSSGIIHWIYLRWNSNVSGSAYPVDLRHAAEGGSPETIQTSPDTSIRFNPFDVIVIGGSVYVANWRNETYLSSWVGTPDTAPVWAAVDIDTSSGAQFGSFTYDSDAGVLYAFYSFFSGGVYTLWRATLTAGVWIDQTLVYDPALNPVADGDADSNFDALNAVLVQGRFGVGAMVRFGGLQRAVFFTGAGGAVQNYCF